MGRVFPDQDVVVVLLQVGERILELWQLGSLKKEFCDFERRFLAYRVLHEV